MSDNKDEIQNENSNDAKIERIQTTLKENPNSLFLMKKGDYSVHVLIEEVKNLLSIKENTLPKPIVKVTCFGQTKRTSKPKDDCDAYVFISCLCRLPVSASGPPDVFYYQDIHSLPERICLFPSRQHWGLIRGFSGDQPASCSLKALSLWSSPSLRP